MHEGTSLVQALAVHIEHKIYLFGMFDIQNSLLKDIDLFFKRLFGIGQSLFKHSKLNLFVVDCYALLRSL